MVAAGQTRIGSGDKCHYFKDLSRGFRTCGNGAGKFINHGVLESREAAFGHGQAIRLEMGRIGQANEMGDKAQARLTALKLSKQHIVSVDLVSDRIQVSNVAGLP